MNHLNQIKETKKGKGIDAILGDIASLEMEEKKKDRIVTAGLPPGGGDVNPLILAEKLAESNKRAVEDQVARFGGKNNNKTDDREKELLAQSASLPNIAGVGGKSNNQSKNKQADQFGFVSKTEVKDSYRRSGRRRSSFGSMREKGDPSNSVLPPVDPLGRNFKSNTKSKGDVEREKRQRKMRKTLEPGSVKFDVGLTVESLKDSGKKREERQTIAREKREAMLEAQRAAVLDSIDSKEVKRKAFQKRKEMEVLQRKLLTFVSLASKMKVWCDKAADAIKVWEETKVLHMAAKVIQKSWKKFIRNLKLKQAAVIRQKLSHCEWRVLMWYRCTKRKMQAQLLRTFFKDFAVQQVAYIMFTFRYRVVRVQRMVRSFLQCKRARKQVLEKLWYKLEKKVSSSEESAFKKRKNSVIPALGSKLEAASSRFEAMERLMKKKNKDVAEVAFGANGGQDESNLLAATSTMVETTPKGVDLNTMRFLIRVHLEEERMHHTAHAADFLEEQRSAPLVNEDHARALLAGELLHVEANTERKWPVFPLFRGCRDWCKGIKNGKLAPGMQRFFMTIEEAIKDKEAVDQRVEERKINEYKMLIANRFEAIEEGDEEGDEEDGGGGDEESEEDEAMTPEEEAAENEELAKKYETTAMEIQEYREMFQLVDLDHGGSIDAEEFGQLLSLLGMEKSEEEIQEMVDKIDTTGQGEVFFPDFARAMKSDRPSPQYTMEMVMESFKLFNKGMAVGVILKNQLCKGLMSYKGKWSEEEAENALHDAGLNQMEIDYSSYVKVMFQLSKG